MLFNLVISRGVAGLGAEGLGVEVALARGAMGGMAMDPDIVQLATLLVAAL